MSTQSLGQYLHGPKDLRLQSQPLPPPADDEVQVSIRSTTLCGSDLHYYQHFRNGTILVREPLCLGHESAGEVIGLGAKVGQLNPTLSIGAKVALEVGVPCENCDLCSNGRYNICSNLRFRSSGSKFPHFQGTLQEHLNHPARWVHKLPDDIDYDIGALLEPLAVAIHAVRRIQAPSQPGTWNCLIFGAGAVGLLCAAASRAEGCKNVVMADIDPGRLQFALKHGFASAIYLVPGKKPTSLEANKHVAREIEKVKLPDGSAIGKADAVLECTGVESCLQASIYATRSGGRVLLVGMGIPNHTLPISEAFSREIDLIPTWRYANAYPRAIEVATASVNRTSINDVTLPDVRKLITHRFEGIEAVPTAFQTAAKTVDESGSLVVKTVVNIPRKARF